VLLLLLLRQNLLVVSGVCVAGAAGLQRKSGGYLWLLYVTCYFVMSCCHAWLGVTKLVHAAKGACGSWVAMCAGLRKKGGQGERVSQHNSHLLQPLLLTICGRWFSRRGFGLAGGAMHHNTLHMSRLVWQVLCYIKQ
jgi:hypothetical protein